MRPEVGIDDFVRPRLGQPAPVYPGADPQAGDEADFTFWDFLDVINPLQHIPVVSTIYRELTGDEISAPAQVMGGMLFGGGFGMAASLVQVVADEVAGEDLDRAMLGGLLGDDESPSQLASLAPTVASEGAMDKRYAALVQSPSQQALPETRQASGRENSVVTTEDGLPRAQPFAGLGGSLGPVPESNSSVLTGDDALRAFLMDVGALAAPASAPAPAASNSAKEPPRQTQKVQVRSEEPEIRAPDVIRLEEEAAAPVEDVMAQSEVFSLMLAQSQLDSEAFSDRVMAGLAQYEAMSKVRLASPGTREES